MPVSSKTEFDHVMLMGICGVIDRYVLPSHLLGIDTNGISAPIIVHQCNPHKFIFTEGVRSRVYLATTPALFNAW